MLDDDKPEDESDEWEPFREEDGEPISIADLKRLDLKQMPEDIHIWLMANYFPEASITRDGESLLCRIEEHIYTKFWEHKFSAYAFSEAMERAVRRLALFAVVRG